MKLDKISKNYRVVTEELTLEEYFNKAVQDPSLYSSPHARLLKAIGAPEVIDTRNDPVLSKIFSNKVIRRYKPFAAMFGMEAVVEAIVGYLEHADQGLEERKQILYLLGPVGGGKSSLAETIKSLMEQEPFYAVKGSPIFENPLALIRLFPELNKELNLPSYMIPACVSPWLTKRIDELDGDISQLIVVKLYPSQHKQVACSKTEPGDENNQDISTLVGKLDIRKLEHFAQDDPDAYRFNGGLCLGNRGVLEFVEMFKAPLKVLNPLLTATQEGNYKGTEAIAAMPFDGIILSHSNESEWASFKENKQNEAFLDRICIVKVPYNLRYTEETKIYSKYMQNSQLKDASTAPHTLDILAKFAVLTRLEPLSSDSRVPQLEVKMQVYNGENVKEKYPSVLSLQEYKSKATLAEGFSGFSTRTAFKLLSSTYNYDPSEKAANPVHLLALLREQIINDDLPKDKKEIWLSFLSSYLVPNYIEALRKDIQIAYLDSYSEYGQNIFNRYINYADFWIQDTDYRDPDTGQIYDHTALNAELEQIEKPAGISNPKDFRHEVVNADLRYGAKNNGKHIPWTSNERIKAVLEKKLFQTIDDILPQISFEKPNDTTDESKKRKNFIKRMMEKGYTERQVKLVVNYFDAYRHSK